MKFMLAILGLAFGLTGCGAKVEPNTAEREKCYGAAAVAYQARTAMCPLEPQDAFDSCEAVEADTWKKEQEACP